MTDTRTEDPAEIEREIRRTQDNMSRTVDKIGDQLTIKNMFNSLLDKADENNIDARMVFDGARRNPVALGLIAAGAIWLVSDKDATFPSLGSKPNGSDTSNETGKSGLFSKRRNQSEGDAYHRDYVSHMSTVERRPDEDEASYWRRRDTARSNYLMVERNHDEDEGSFRQRLNDMTDKFREKRHAWSESTQHASAATLRSAQAAVGEAGQLAGKAQDLYVSNPLIGGILAAAVGAAFGSALPVTDQERKSLGTIGNKARDLVDQQKSQVAAQVRDKKDELLDQADAALRPKAQPQQDAPADQQSPQFDEPHKPFIASH